MFFLRVLRLQSGLHLFTFFWACRLYLFLLVCVTIGQCMCWSFVWHSSYMRLPILWLQRLQHVQQDEKKQSFYRLWRKRGGVPTLDTARYGTRGFQLLMNIRKNIRQVLSMRKKIPKCRNLTSIGTMHYFQGYYSSCHILATVSRVAIDFFSPFHICLRAFYVKNAKKDRYCSNANYEVSSIIESQTPDSSFRSGFYYRSTASPKPSSKQSVYPFNFQYPVSSLRS